MNDSQSKPDQNEKILAGLGYFGFAFVLPLAIRPDSSFCRLHGKQALVLNLVFFLSTKFIYIFSFFARGFYSFLTFLWIFSMMFMSFLTFSGALKKIPFLFSVSSKLQIFPDEVVAVTSSEEVANAEASSAEGVQNASNPPVQNSPAEVNNTEVASETVDNSASNTTNNPPAN